MCGVLISVTDKPTTVAARIVVPRRDGVSGNLGSINPDFGRRDKSIPGQNQGW